MWEYFEQLNDAIKNGTFMKYLVLKMLLIVIEKIHLRVLLLLILLLLLWNIFSKWNDDEW